MSSHNALAASPLSRPILEELAEAKHRARAKAEVFVWNPTAEDRTSRAPRKGSAPPSRPLRVLLSDSGKSAFTAMQDPRIRLVSMAAVADEPPDVLVITHADRLRLNDSSKDVPSEVWARLASGEVTLVFDASGEGNPHKADRTEILHGFLREKGVPLQAAAYMTQDREYGRHYADYCGATGLGPNQMRVWIFDRYIQSLFSHPVERGEALFEERFALYCSRPRQRARRFISLNYTVRPIRAIFLLSLLRDSLWDKGFISVGQVGLTNGGRMLSREQQLAKLHELSGLRSLVAELAPYLDELERRAPITLGVDPAADAKVLKRALLQASPLAEYHQSWFSVVIDSHVSDRLHRITEKPFKPLVNFHPMILLGAAWARRLVSTYGFESFPALFDESFDDVPDHQHRFEAVYDQVHRLCLIPEAELATRELDARGAVLFNAWWGLVELPQLFRSCIEAALVDELVDLIETRTRGALTS